MSTTKKTTIKTKTPKDVKKEVETTKPSIEDLMEEIKRLNEKIEHDNANKISSSVTMSRIYVKVISLFDGILTLSTEPFGRGVSYTWDKFGHDQMILDTTLRDLIASSINNEKARQGIFFIDDKEFTNAVGLAVYYENMLDYNEFNTVLQTTNEQLVKALFEKATDAQKEILISLIVQQGTSGNIKDQIYSAIESVYNVNKKRSDRDYLSIREKIDTNNKYMEIYKEESE